jgi:hypothetical protein
MPGVTTAARQPSPPAVGSEGRRGVESQRILACYCRATIPNSSSDYTLEFPQKEGCTLPNAEVEAESAISFMFGSHARYSLCLIISSFLSSAKNCYTQKHLRVLPQEEEG